MKRFIIPMISVVIMAAACTLQEESPVTCDGTRLMFLGDASTSTKVSFGEKDGEVYPLLWSTGDVISVNSTDGTINGELADLYSSAGSSSGTFQAENDIIPDSDKDLVILYPGKTLSYEGGVISGSVSSTQTQTSANTSDRIGANTIAYAKTSVTAGQRENVTFALRHEAAFVKVRINKMEGYENCYLTGISIQSDNAALAGNFTYDIDSGQLTVTDAIDKVGATIMATSAVLSEDQAVYFTALPCDLTDKTVTVTIDMNSNGNAISLPVEINGGELRSGYLSIITVTTDSYSWYEPIETRDLLNAWAYGPQNTYFIEQSENESGHITIDVKARGDMSKVTRPKYFGLITGSDIDGRKLCYLADGTDTYQAEPTNEVNGDCTIDVYCYPQSQGEGHWAVVAIYDEDYNILWSYMIWKYLTGDEPTGHTYGGSVTVLDRTIGSPYGSALAASKGNYDAPSIAVFQWGRKDPFPFKQFSPYATATESGGADIATAVAHPYIAYWTGGEWLSSGNGMRSDLWGGDASGIDGATAAHKTIYDPCPEGWRVCDASTVNILRNNTDGNTEYWEYDINYDEAQQPSTKINPSSPFYAEQQSVLAYKLSDGTYDYWPFSGLKKFDNTSYTHDDADYKNRAIAIWTANAAADTQTTYNGAMWRYLYSAGKHSEATGIGQEQGGQVRCQKE